MKLKRLEIYGFKSFAQRTEIAFNQGITGIVGPNGSGKSNISDAVRWVLGEQSAKALRGAKMEDVIFSGTEQRKAMPYCEVSLVFDNEDGALHTQYTDVMVTRRVYRSGEGEYYLNKSACRLKDIIELFRDTGIGKEGYSIIGQGRIDDILSARGDERRNVFEEAAGIVTYRVRKEEAERNLQKTRENLVRVNDLIDEIENRIGPLSAQAETARRYLELSSRLKDLELNIFLVRHARLKERMETMREGMQKQEEVRRGYEQRLNELGLLRNELNREQEKVENAIEAARLLLEEKMSALSEAQTDKERRSARLQAAGQEIERLKEANLQSEEKIKELDALFEKGSLDTEKTGEQQRQAKAVLDEEESKLKALAHEAEECEQRLDSHKERILSAANRLTDFKSMEARQQAMLTQMRSRSEEIVAAIDEIREKESRLNEALQAGRLQKKEVDEALEGMKQDALQIEQTLKQRIAAFETLEKDMRRLADKTQADMSRYNLLEEMSRGYEGYYGAVRKAIAYAKNDPKVHGVVARLIRVPKAYETAIDMILGGTLQHIITEDEETAKALIDYLRINKLGRTTFLPLSAVQPRTLSPQERKSLSLPGCLGVASELIEYDAAYKGIIENILGRTVIARDLNAAIAIMRFGRHSFNVVTLAGDVMRAGGAMTGGTNQNQSISLLGREREIKELKETIASQQNDLEAMQTEWEGLLKQRQEFERLHKEAYDRLHDEEIAVAREQERVQNAEESLRACQEELQSTLEAKQQLEEAIDEIERDLKTATDRTRDVSMDREAMEKETEALQEKLLSARNLVDEQRDKVGRLQVDFASFAHTLDVLMRDKHRFGEEKAREQALLAKNKGRLSALADDFERETEELSAKEQETKALSAQRQEAEERSLLVDAERKQLMQRQKDMQDETENMHGLLTDTSSKLHRSEMVLARTEDELQQLTDHIWNTYELTYAGAEAFRVEGKFDLVSGEREAGGLKKEIRDMGPINVHAVEEYAETKDRLDQMVLQRDDASKAEKDLVGLIEKLLSSMEKQFVSEFEKLNGYFGETFKRLFGGGQAELKLTDPSMPLTCGIEIVAQPPGKKLQLLSLLSGGERALTAIAILFAMLKLKPTPFCILDEIEAALDEANIGYFADYLAEYAKTTQFIVVSHRKGTMERCDALYGVAMQEKGVSSMVSVNLETIK